MANEKDNRIITEKHEKEVPRTVTEQRTVQEPKTVMEKQTIEVPKTVMEERVVEEEKTVMEKQTFYRLVSASCKELDGYEVVDTTGEKVGSFDDVMLDLRSGRIAYAVIEMTGGFLGMGNKSVAVPWDSLTVEGAEEMSQEGTTHRMVLNIPKDQLKEAPDYKKSEWPDQPDRDWLNQNLYSRYGYQPWWDTSYHGNPHYHSDEPRVNP